MPRVFNADRAASALVHAAFHNDNSAAAEFRVSVRSIQLWRERINTDEDLAELFAHKSARFERRWQVQVGKSLYAAMDFVIRATDAMDPSNPADLKAVTRLMELLFEFQLTREMIAARAESLIASGRFELDS